MSPCSVVASKTAVVEAGLFLLPVCLLWYRPKAAEHGSKSVGQVDFLGGEEMGLRQGLAQAGCLLLCLVQLRLCRMESHDGFGPVSILQLVPVGQFARRC